MKEPTGYHVEKYGGGRYTSVAWSKKKEDADKELKWIMMTNAWSGMPPRIVPSY